MASRSDSSRFSRSAARSKELVTASNAELTVLLLHHRFSRQRREPYNCRRRSGTSGRVFAEGDGRMEGIEEAFERLNRFVAQSMERARTPGLALALTDRDGLIRVTTYGYADMAARMAVRPETLF